MRLNYESNWKLFLKIDYKPYLLAITKPLLTLYHHLCYYPVKPVVNQKILAKNKFRGSEYIFGNRT